MARTKVTIVRVDPYHKTFKFLLPECIERLTDSLSQMEGLDTAVPVFLSRLVAKDPGVLLIVAIDQTGKIKGFCAGVFDDGVVTHTVPRIDEPTENDAAGEMIQFIDNWAASLGSPKVFMLTKRLDHKWTEKYGYKVSRYILGRDIVESE